MRVLVTGARGFIGLPCSAALDAGGAEVHALDSAHPPSTSGGVHWHRFDLLGSESPAALLATIRPTHLLHLAWITTPGRYLTSEANDLWVEAGQRLLESFLEAGGRRIVAAGTCLEYAPGAGVCDEETTPIEPDTLYGASKARFHRALRTLASASGASAAWGRVFFLYGPREQPGRLVPSVIRSLLRGETADCTEGMQRRDFMHVDDVAAAFVALLRSNLDGAVNIGSGRAVAVRDVALAIGRLLGAEDRVRLGALPARTDDPPLIVARPGKLAEHLGFAPRVGLEQGLAATIAWWQKAEDDAQRAS